MAKKPGIQGPGRKRLQSNWEEIENPTPKTSWLIGEPSEAEKRLGEQIRQYNEERLAELDVDTQDVHTLPDLWPSRANYYKGPSNSTRVSRHKFVPVTTATGVILMGTVYVQFTNMRPNGNIRREDVYEYRNVPYTEYESFLNTNSKGQKINEWTRRFKYKNLNKDTSVFSES